jgi:hypothetical protein
MFRFSLTETAIPARRTSPVWGLRTTALATTVLGLVLGVSAAGVAQDEPGANDAVSSPPTAQDAATASSLLRGTWDYALADEEIEFLAEAFGPEEAAAVGIPGRSTSIRLGFEDDTWWQGFVFDGDLWLLDGVPEGDGGRITFEGDELTVTGPVDLGNGAGYVRYGWAVEGDELTLTLLECARPFGAGECPDTDIVRFVMEHTYTASGTDPGY